MWEFPFSNVPEGAIIDVDIDDEGNIYAVSSRVVSNISEDFSVIYWNGQEWETLGPVFKGQQIQTIAIKGNEIYIGGRFSEVGGDQVVNVAHWNDEKWEGLGEGLRFWVYDLEIHKGEVCAAGLFDSTDDGETDLNGVACWDGENWYPLGQGFENIGNGFGDVREVRTLHSNGDILYAGGTFSRSGGVEVNSIAQWDGTHWMPVGEGLSGQVWSITTTESGEVYAGGIFEHALDGAFAHNVARWNGESWHALGEGLRVQVVDLEYHEGSLYAGGVGLFFGVLNEDHGVAQWSGREWVTVGEGITSTVRSLTVVDDLLYAGGGFLDRDSTVHVLATWNGSTTVSTQRHETPPNDKTIIQSIYPSPFAHVTHIIVRLNKEETVRISAFDVLGREVVKVFNGTLPVGMHEFTLDAAGLMPLGMYIVRVSTEHRVESMRIVKAN